MRNGLPICHLLFANDSLLFCGADLRRLGYLRYVLLFEAVTG